MRILEAITFLTDDAHIKKICQKTAVLFQQYLEDVVKENCPSGKMRLILEEKLAREGFRVPRWRGLTLRIRSNGKNRRTARS